MTLEEKQKKLNKLINDEMYFESEVKKTLQEIDDLKIEIMRDLCKEVAMRNKEVVPIYETAAMQSILNPDIFGHVPEFLREPRRIKCANLYIDHFAHSNELVRTAFKSKFYFIGATKVRKTNLHSYFFFVALGRPSWLDPEEDKLDELSESEYEYCVGCFREQDSEFFKRNQHITPSDVIFEISR